MFVDVDVVGYSISSYSVVYAVKIIVVLIALVHLHWSHRCQSNQIVLVQGTHQVWVVRCVLHTKVVHIDGTICSLSLVDRAHRVSPLSGVIVLVPQITIFHSDGS